MKLGRQENHTFRKICKNTDKNKSTEQISETSEFKMLIIPGKLLQRGSFLIGSVL